MAQRDDPNISSEPHSHCVFIFHFIPTISLLQFFPFLVLGGNISHIKDNDSTTKQCSSPKTKLKKMKEKEQVSNLSKFTDFRWDAVKYRAFSSFVAIALATSASNHCHSRSQAMAMSRLPMLSCVATSPSSRPSDENEVSSCRRCCCCC